MVPVNAVLAGKTLWGRTVLPDLRSVPEAVDMVDVFRRADFLAGHLDDILAMKPLPRVVWLQLGIHDAAFAERLRAHGIEVVESRCTLADHQSLGLGPPRPRQG